MWKLPPKYLLLAVFACLLWSTAFVGVKIGLQYAPPFGFAGIRFFLSGLILVPFIGLRRNLAVFKTHWRWVVLLGFIQTFVNYALFYFGMTLVSGALAAIVIGSQPLIFALVAHVLMKDDKITLPKLVSLLIGFIGVAIIGISRQPWQAAGLVEFGGVLFLLAASTVAAIGNVMISKNNAPIPPVALNSFQLIIGGFLLMLLALIVEGNPFQRYPVDYYTALAYLTVLSAAALSIWFYLLKKPDVKVSSLNLWKFIIPVFGAVLAWSILPDEHPEPAAILGMVFVALSILSFNLCNLVSKSCD